MSHNTFEQIWWCLYFNNNEMPSLSKTYGCGIAGILRGVSFLNQHSLLCSVNTTNSNDESQTVEASGKTDHQY